MKHPREVIQTNFHKSISDIDYFYCRKCRCYKERRLFRAHAITNRISLCKLCQNTNFKDRLGKLNHPKRILFNLKQYSRRKGYTYGRHWELSDVVNRLSTSGLNWELIKKLIYIRPANEDQPFTLQNSRVLIAKGIKPRFSDTKL